jgi:hypothetical protein
MVKRLLVSVCVVVSVGTAQAQVRPEAEKLFRDGKELMKAGKFAEACTAFEASERAEHNISTLLNLADCREKNGQFASAWALFLQAVSQTRTDPQQVTLNATAKSRAAQLEPRLSYLTINVPDESRVPDLAVTRDGIPIDPGEWNRALPIDGGEHEIAGKAPGHESWSTKVTLQPEHDKQAVEVPRFKELPKLAPPVTDAVQADLSTPAPSMFTPRRKLAVGVAAGGLVLAGVGAGFAISASSLRSEAVASCPSTSCTVQDAADAQSLNDRARKRALIANIGFAAGAAAVIAGGVLWFTGAPPSTEPEITMVPQLGDSTGLAVMGTF